MTNRDFENKQKIQRLITMGVLSYIVKDALKNKNINNNSGFKNSRFRKDLKMLFGNIDENKTSFAAGIGAGIGAFTGLYYGMKRSRSSGPNRSLENQVRVRSGSNVSLIASDEFDTSIRQVPDESNRSLFQSARDMFGKLGFATGRDTEFESLDV